MGSLPLYGGTFGGVGIQKVDSAEFWVGQSVVPPKNARLSRGAA